MHKNWPEPYSSSLRCALEQGRLFYAYLAVHFATLSMFSTFPCLTKLWHVQWLFW